MFSVERGSMASPAAVSETPDWVDSCARVRSKKSDDVWKELSKRALGERAGGE